MKSMLQVGTVLHNGKYKIERYLSSGGFGNTYIAIDTTFDNEIVVLKEFFIRGINERDDNSLSISVSNESNTEQFEEQKEKFWREAQRLRQLRHPNIVGVHDRFEENGTAYYVMDFIDGKSISDILKRDKEPYSEERALEIISKVVDALGVVHGKDMFHMDIKPGNIMLDSKGEVKLIDFGASKQIVAGKNSAISVSTSGFCFTPGYAPSEQVNQLGKNIGPWTDFYAVGGTLFNLLTLLPPPSMSDILEDEEDAFKFPDSVSQHTRQLIYWMMRPQRALRPQSAEELLTAIRGGEVPERRRKKTSSVEDAPVEDAPVEVTPVKSAPVKSSPVKSAPLDETTKLVEEEPKKPEPKKEKKQPVKVVDNPEPQQDDTEKKSKKPMVIAIAAIALLIFIVFGVYGFMSKGDGSSVVPDTISVAETDSVDADSVAKAQAAQAEAEAKAKEDSIKQAQEAARQAEESAKKQAEQRVQQEAAKRQAKQAAAQRQQKPKPTRQRSKPASSTPAKPSKPSSGININFN